MRVMLVEDDETIRETMVSIIEAMGHHAFVAKNDEEAIELAKTVNPDVALVDLVLNGHVATPLVEFLKDVTNGDSPRIIVVSAMVGAKTTAERLGVEFLPKPFDIDALERAIKH